MLFSGGRAVLLKKTHVLGFSFSGNQLLAHATHTPQSHCEPRHPTHPTHPTSMDARQPAMDDGSLAEMLLEIRRADEIRRAYRARPVAKSELPPPRSEQQPERERQSNRRSQTKDGQWEPEPEPEPRPWSRSRREEEPEEPEDVTAAGGLPPPSRVQVNAHTHTRTTCVM